MRLEAFLLLSAWRQLSRRLELMVLTVLTAEAKSQATIGNSADRGNRVNLGVGAMLPQRRRRSGRRYQW